MNWVGVVAGEPDGAEVGPSDGAGMGLADGAGLGLADGAGLGIGVGTIVGTGHVPGSLPNPIVVSPYICTLKTSSYVSCTRS